jgi:tetratricopeptide (TPR) repeat protein
MSEDDAKDFLLELCPRIGDKATKLAEACTYLPLALRIAGSFLQVNIEWPVEKYLEQLKDRRHRLATLKESRAEAELTAEPDLIAAFELSYNQLNAEGRKRWRMLGVFPASFDALAAQAMWEIEEEETARSLGSLRRYSLMEYDENTRRYTLHDLLADYALGQMGGGEEQSARIKHASHFMEMMNVADALYLEGGENILLGLRLFDLEWEHIRSAQAWIAENIEETRQITELAMMYPGAAAYCLDLRLAPKQKIEWLKLAVTSAQQLENKEYEGIHLGNLGLAYATLGDARKAIEFYEQALVIAREIGDRRGEGNALGNLGNALYKLGDKQKGIDMVSQALSIFESIESPNADWARKKLEEWGALE